MAKSKSIRPSHQVVNRALPFSYKISRGNVEPDFEGNSPYGSIRFLLPDGNTIEVEAYIRGGNPVGLLIRGICCQLDIQPDSSNTVFIKPRP